MRVSFCRYRLLGAGMHYIVIASLAVATVAFTCTLQEFRRRSRAISEVKPLERANREGRYPNPAAVTRNLLVRHSKDGSHGEAA